MKKRKIIVTHATSNDNEIIFYLSSQLNSYVKGGYINNKNYMYISIENKNSSEEFRKSCKIILLSILHTLFLLISNLLLFLLMPIHFSLSFILSTSVPLLLMFFIYSCRSFFLVILTKKRTMQLCT